MKSNLLFIVSILFIISIAVLSRHTSGYKWLNWILYIGYGVVAIHTAPDWAINIVVGLIKVILAVIILFAIFILSIIALPCLLLIVPCVLLEKKKCKEAQ